MDNKAIEIPFGANDSELKGWEYTIPEGMEAEIKDGKVIVKEKKDEDERIRKEIIGYLNSRVATAEETELLYFKRWIAYLEKQKEIPMPNSTKLIEMWDAEKEMLKEKDFRDDAWRLAYNAFLDGFARGTCVKSEKQKEQEFTHHEIDESLQSAVAHQMEDDGDVDDFVRRGIDDIVLKYAELGARWQKEQKPITTDAPFNPDDYEVVMEGKATSLKQKEQKPAEWDELQADFRNINEAFEDGKKEVVAHPEKYGLFKPVEWSEDFEENIRTLLHNKFTWHSEDGKMSSTVFIDDKTLKDIVSGIWFYVGKEALKYPNKEIHVQEWSEKDEKMLNELITIMEGGKVMSGTYLSEYAHFLKSLPERFNLQPKQEWSEDYREEDLRTRFAFYTYKNEEDDGVLYLSNVFVEEASRNKGFGTKILAAAENVAETLGAIKIRLKVKQNSPANAWYRKHGYGYMTFEDGYDWLEKTLEYMKPIKSEWSEEDNIGWDEAFACVTRAEKAAKNEEELQNAVTAEKWLKEIKFKYYVHPVKQEWSEEDKRKLNRIYEILGYAADDRGFLTSKRIIGDKEAVELQDFLKSLRPQSKEELAKMLQDEYNKGKEIGEKEGYTKGYNKGYKDANESVSYHFPVMPTTPSGFGCDGTYCTNPHMDCINCPRKSTGGFMASPNTVTTFGTLWWKPSEEQMEALKDAVRLYKETHFERFHHRIESLYEQLKKL